MTTLDIVLLLGWLAATFAAGLWFGRRSSQTTEGFFAADRSLPWWVVGTSMVATTFAADTPLVVSGFVATGGIAANWKWWWLGAAGVLSVFLFSHLWRRAGVLTDAELTELRYSGRAATVLRGAKAVWFGIFMNVLVIAWVMAAMGKILHTVLPLPESFLGLPADNAIVLGLFVLTVIYTTASGLLGVVATDVAQFILAMGGSILLAVLAWTSVGGLEGMQAGFATHGLDWASTTSMWPTDGAADGAQAQTVVLLSVIWYASKQVDGDGYLAQRLFATKDDRHAVWAYLWFTVANLCLRPWPWIVVGLAGMATLGPLEDPELYYPRMMAELLPSGLFGLVLASFLAAFMSTIDTQLNWGASLVTNDLWCRFIRPDADEASQMRASRGAVLTLAALGAGASFFVDSLGGAWELAFSVTAGIGLVSIARWYWWRTNAWSEITAMVLAVGLTMVASTLSAMHPAQGGEAQWLAALPAGWLSFPFSAAAVTFLGFPVWMAVTLLTEPVPKEHLLAFYRRVRPGGWGWRAVAQHEVGFDADGPTRFTFLGILGGIAAVYGMLFGIGWVLLGQTPWAVGAWGVALVGGGLATLGLRQHTTVRGEA